MPHKTRRWVLAALSATAVMLVSTSAALGAGPTATTGAATNITNTSAKLNGTVSPNKVSTTYYFQYGTTKSYGTNTTPATANGNASKAVSASVTGLIPATTYHFRLLASNSTGTSHGVDKTFTTASAVGGGKNSVTISSLPGAVTFGHTATLSGKASGPGKGGALVALESNPYPYTHGFKPTGATTTTSQNGTYAFTVRPRVNTRYEVMAATKTPATSAPTTVGVKVRVTIHVSTLRPFLGHLVRFFGTVTPAHNGRFAQIQRRTSTGAWRTVASTKLVAAGKVNGISISRYSRRIRIRHSGTYRVRVNPHDGNHRAGNSATRRERVR
ncbi:MAG: fibronectin type III domain-containing protein [Actinomycetota bacterium]|nr:fibronectin type III domain-containing protein [Actinomycetota bacterium]